MNFLVIGLGSMGKRRIRCLKTLGITKIYGFDSRNDRCQEVQQEYNIKTFDNFEEHNIFNSAHPLHSDYEIKLASLKEYNKSLNENLPYGSSGVLVEFPTLT